MLHAERVAELVSLHAAGALVQLAGLRDVYARCATDFLLADDMPWARDMAALYKQADELIRDLLAEPVTS